jgi:hypothetical protein
VIGWVQFFRAGGPQGPQLEDAPERIEKNARMPVMLMNDFIDSTQVRQRKTGAGPQPSD